MEITMPEWMKGKDIKVFDEDKVHDMCIKIILDGLDCETPCSRCALNSLFNYLSWSREKINGTS